MKETFYFSHDYHARDDEKIIRLIKKEGYEGYGLYWSIIEMLYEQEGYMRLDCDCIAFALRTDSDCINNIIQNYDLFKFKDDKFFSDSVIKRLEKRKNIGEKYRQNAFKRWDKTSRDKEELVNGMRM